MSITHVLECCNNPASPVDCWYTHQVAPYVIIKSPSCQHGPRSFCCVCVSSLQGKRQFSDYSSHGRQQPQQQDEGYGEEGDVQMKRARGPRRGRRQQRQQQDGEGGGFVDGDEAMQDVEVRGGFSTMLRWL